MHTQTLETWRHSHHFVVIHEKNEHRAIAVFAITAVTMMVEIVAGSIFSSMALLADGWHMGTHAAAFLITIFAYQYARKNENNPSFVFGTGKVGVLGGFASATALAVVALFMAVESVERILKPQIIQFDEAISVAAIGLLINVVSAFLLRDHHPHHDHHEPHHRDHDQCHDHNLKAAYFHVLADALTSVLAITSLLAGKMFALNWLDPIMGIVGALIITRWSYSLLKETAPILIDKTIEEHIQSKIIEKVESDADNRISDLHLWKVAPDDYAAIISLVTHFPKPVNHYKQLLEDIHELSHLTIEVNQCVGDPCRVPTSGAA